MNQKVLLFSALSLAARFVDAKATQEEVDAANPGMFLYAVATECGDERRDDAMRQIAGNVTPDPEVARIICGLRANATEEATLPDSLTFYGPDGAALIVLDAQTPQSDTDINALLDNAWSGMTNVDDLSQRVQAVFSSAVQPFAMANALATTMKGRNAIFAGAFQALNEGTDAGNGQMFGVEADGNIRDITVEVQDAVAELEGEPAVEQIHDPRD